MLKPQVEYNIDEMIAQLITRTIRDHATSQDLMLAAEVLHVVGLATKEMQFEKRLITVTFKPTSDLSSRVKILASKSA